MLPDLDSRLIDSRTYRRMGSHHFSPHPPVPWAFTASLPFSLQSYNVVRLHSLCLMGKGLYRPRPEVNGCYGCLCLLNIMMVLWGVTPL